MRATELRIGNLVWSNYGSYDRLEDYVVLLHEDFLLTKGHGKSNIAFHFIDPIPLTEEWLLKFGFENEFVAMTNSNFWSNGEHEIFQYLDQRVFKYDMLILDDGVDVKHVHQLQNLYFALTGEELTIKEQ